MSIHAIASLVHFQDKIAFRIPFYALCVETNPVIATVCSG